MSVIITVAAAILAGLLGCIAWLLVDISVALRGLKDAVVSSLDPYAEDRRQQISERLAAQRYKPAAMPEYQDEPEPGPPEPPPCLP